MDNSLLSDLTPSQTAGILAIEPDPARVQVLRAALEPSGVHLEIVPGVEDAIHAIARRMPHLVIAPTFLPPDDEARLTAHIRQMPSAAHLQIIDVPYFDPDQPTPPDPNRRVLGFLRRRPAAVAPLDVAALRRRIELYLRQAGDVHRDLYDRGEMPLVRMSKSSAKKLDAPALEDAPPHRFSVRADTSILSQRDDRRRARRRRREELPALWAVKHPSVADLGIVDISSAGVLLETASKIAPGSIVDLQLVGGDLNMYVPARMVRCEIAGVSGLGVRYRIAAAFSRELNLVELASSDGRPALTPKALGDVVARVLGQLTTASEARSRFESELRWLLPVRDIQIRQKPMITEPGTESIYFAVPHGSGRILQVTFDAAHHLSAMEFRILKAAASLAAAVLEVAPADARG